MRVKSNKLALRVLSTATFLAMVSSCATAAFAGTYYMEDGSISIVAKTDGNYITQGDINDKKDEGETVITNRDSSTASENTVTIKAEEGSTANVTLDNVNIDASGTGKAAIYTEGKVTLELDGNNTLTGGEGHAALEKISNAKNNVPDENYTLTLQDETTGDGKTGSLTATGGAGGAGIGGSVQTAGGYVNNITITGGTITATAGSNSGKGRVNCGAGIGGGAFGEGNNITITGGTVNATGGEGNDSYAFGGAGIGGGFRPAGSVNGVTISGGTVIATGNGSAAGIGGGSDVFGATVAGSANDITISGGNVTAIGGKGSDSISGKESDSISGGAGIGGGKKIDTDAISGSGNTITISGEATQVTATGNAGGAGIGGGNGGYGAKITVNDGTVTANGNGGGAGIGGGKGGLAQLLTITGGEVTANGGGGGAGIGTGDASNADPAQVRGNKIQISGGVVTANGGAEGGAGIGGGKGTAASAKNGGNGVTITDGTVTANGGKGAAGIGSGAGSVWALGSFVDITGGTVTANGGAGEAAGIGNGENDANDAAVNISATTARLDVTAVTQGSDEAITGGDDMTMAELNNQFSGVVRFFRGTNHYNTVHNGKYVGMADNNADEHQETDAHIWGSTEIIRQATPTEQGILRHHCAVDGCKGYYEEFFDYAAPAEPVTPAPTDPDTPDVPGTSDSTPGAPAQGTPADTAVTPDAVQADAAVTPAAVQNAVQGAKPEAAVTAAALPKTGVNWLAAVGSAISGMVLLAAGYVLDRKSRRQN